MKPHVLSWGAVLVALAAAACASGSQGGEQPQGPGPSGPYAGGPGARRGVPQRPGFVGAMLPAPPAFPDTTLFGTAVLIAARAPDTSVWLGTYGKGLYLARPRARTWEQIASKSGDSTSISWDFVNAVGFTRHSVWYGTVGNGFGRSLDGGKTWQNWGMRQLGPEWQYVAPDGIHGHGDTIYIATADGLRITSDDGRTWRCIRGPAPATPPAAPPRDGCTESIASLPTEYLLALEIAPDGAIWVGHLKGASVSRDRGTTWTAAPGIPAVRVRAIRAASDSSIWIATESAYYRSTNLKGTEFRAAAVSVGGYGAPPGAPRAFINYPARRAPAIASSRGLLVPEPDSSYHIYTGSGELFHPAADLWTGMWDPGRLLPLTGSDVGFAPLLPITSRAWDLADAPLAFPPADPKHGWLPRPIAPEDNPYIDQTYRYGATMGGAFQQHQGVEFNDPDGTPVHAIADGTVVFAGPAEAGANTVAIRHDQGFNGQSVFSVYYHNTRLDVRSGQHVKAGDVVSFVGNTGRATNDHLHLEVHVASTPDSSKIVNPAERFPPFTVNPQLWIAPIQGDGVVAGRVLDAAGSPVPGARVYGLTLPYPSETPFVFAETYMDKAHPDPAYGENFVVGDVPPGRYLLGAVVAGKPVWRTVDVAAGKVSWVEFRATAATP